MRAAFRRFPLERALQLAIAAFIVTAVLAAGALLSWQESARKGRWVVLAALVAASLAAAPRRKPARRLWPVYGAGCAVVALALTSSLWSSAPKLTAEHAVSLALLFLAAGALAAAAAERPQTGRRLLQGVLAGAAAVAAGGLLVLAFRHDRAVMPATTSLPGRYQGLGGGPDTAAMVLAVAVPIGVWALEEARSAGRLIAAVVLLLMLGSIVASGSRGALAAAFGGTLAYVLVGSRGRRRLVAAAAVVAALGLCVLILRIPQPASASATPVALLKPAGPRPAAGYVNANQLLRLQDDIGHPQLGTADASPRPRTLFGTSGRAEAWAGALGQGIDRPLVGFGFGREDPAFQDRYVDFNSSLVENSYIGLFLQLGVLGVLFLGLLVAAVGAPAVRALDRLEGRQRRLVAACAGGLVAGLVLGLVQSYIYAVGNNATAAVWICAFLLAAATQDAERVGP